jgi:hypothetical protein
MSKEFIVFNNKENFYELDNLERNNKEPTAFNSTVRIKKYKITIELIEEPLERLKERLKELYKKETNWHNKEALNGYSKSIFGVIVSELDKKFTNEEKIKAIREIIDRAEENEHIDLSCFEWKFKSIKFDYQKSENWYSYTAYWNKNTGHSNYYSPSKNSQDILTFKTLAGAKRNFIKRFLNKNA